MRISDWSSDVCSSDLFFGNRHDLNVRCGIEIAAKSDVDRSRTKSFLLAILSHADEDDLRKRDLGTEAAQNHRHGLIDGRAKEREAEAADLAAVGRAAAFTSAARPLNDRRGLFEKDVDGLRVNCPPRRAHEQRHLQRLPQDRKDKRLNYRYSYSTR